MIQNFVNIKIQSPNKKKQKNNKKCMHRIKNPASGHKNIRKKDTP